MKKIKIFSLIVVIISCLTPLFSVIGASSVKIQNPLNGVNNFSDLLLKIAAGVGDLFTYIGVIMIIVAGIFYLTSAGSPERIGTAKKALIYAIVGIVIGLAATAIVNIIKDVLGAS